MSGAAFVQLFPEGSDSPSRFTLPLIGLNLRSVKGNNYGDQARHHTVCCLFFLFNTLFFKCSQPVTNNHFPGHSFRFGGALNFGESFLRSCWRLCSKRSGAHGHRMPWSHSITHQRKALKASITFSGMRLKDAGQQD